VAEKGKFPNIYIYGYPSLKLYRVLKKGTENTFSHCEFSTSGKLLASVGGEPDFTITVWDWMAQRVVLKAKAFSMDVYRVSFSPFSDDTLFTCGSGHIRFWRMA
jgi:WD40 repeat protein